MLERLEVNKNLENLRRLLERMRQEAQRVAENLRNQYEGLEIDSDGRVIPLSSSKTTEQAVEHNVESKRIIEIIGELLELFKFNKLNSEEKSEFISVRTSRYDDVKNHIDEIIFHKETLEPILAIDVTTAGQELVREKKVKVLIEALKRGGGNVKDGFWIERKNGKITFKRKELNKIPVFVVHMNLVELLKNIDNPQFYFSEWLKNEIKKQIEEIINILEKILTTDIFQERKALLDKYKKLKGKLFKKA